MRTNSQDVIDILGTNYDTINCPKLTAYIKAASFVIDDMVDCATDRGVTFSIARLSEIERWLAAYYYTIYDPIYQSKSTANSSATYFERSYKEVAENLDSTGCLSSGLNGTFASFDWLGKIPSEQIDVDDRR